jgi:hypothetical protein
MRGCGKWSTVASYRDMLEPVNSTETPFQLDPNARYSVYIYKAGIKDLVLVNLAMLAMNEGHCLRNKCVWIYLDNVAST